MRANLRTVVGYMLQRHEDFSIYMDNIAMQARKYTSSKPFDGITCKAYQSSKAKKTYLASNFFCTKQAASPDLSKTQVSFLYTVCSVVISMLANLDHMCAWCFTVIIFLAQRWFDISAQYLLLWFVSWRESQMALEAVDNIAGVNEVMSTSTSPSA